MARRSSWNPGLAEELKIGRNTVRIKRSLGEGGFAFIHLVEDVHTGRVLVLKRSSLQSHEGRLVYERETSIMRTLAHPNIVQFVTAVELPNYRSGAILMEYCPRGHLLEALNRLGGQRLPEEAVLSIMSDVVSALKYLHDKGVTHRDIKLDNILRSSSGSYKLCDFGSCVQGRVPLDTAERRANEQEVVEKTTTQMYRAPEMVDLYMERELTEKVDVWALGCVLYAVCYLKNPFQDAGNLGILNARIRIPEDSEFSEGLVELVHRTLTASPTHRPSASEVESGVQALSNGKPLPPLRAPTTAETPRSRGSFESTAAAAAAARTGAAGVSSHDSSRDSGGGAEPGRRSSTSPGSKGKGSTQGTPPGKTSAGASSKAREPQLNPNSVAARRLASRKSSSPSTRVEAEKQPSQKQQQQQGVAGSATHRNSDTHDADQIRHSLVAGGAQGTGATASPDQTWRNSAGRAAAAVATVVAPGGDAPVVGTNDFASFDQFSTSELALGHTDDFPDASFDAPVATKVFGFRPANQGVEGSPGQRAIAAEVGTGSGCDGGGNLGDQRPASPLVDLESPRLVDNEDRDVIALGQQLEGAFPSTSSGATGWNGSGPLQQQAWANEGYVGRGTGAAAGQAFPFVLPQQGANSRPMAPPTVSQVDRGFGCSGPCSSDGSLFGTPDMRRSVSSPSSRRSSGSHPGMTATASVGNRSTSHTAGHHGFTATFPAPQSVGGGSQFNAVFRGGLQPVYGLGAPMSTQRLPQEKQHLGNRSSDAKQGLTGSMTCSKGEFRSAVPETAAAPDGTARVFSTASSQQHQQQQQRKPQDVFSGTDQQRGFPYPSGGGSMR